MEYLFTETHILYVLVYIYDVQLNINNILLHIAGKMKNIKAI